MGDRLVRRLYLLVVEYSVLINAIFSSFFSSINARSNINMQTVENIVTKHTPPFYKTAFYDDIALLLDMYSEDAGIEGLMVRVGKTPCSPKNQDFPMHRVATEIFIPQIVDVGAAMLLKRVAHHLSVKQFRQILTCMTILSNDVLKVFMSTVIWDAKKRGIKGLYAKWVYDFAESYLTVESDYIALKTPINPTHHVNKEQVMDLTKGIIKSLSCQGVIEKMAIHQDSKAVTFTLSDIQLYDTTIIFLMYWLKNIGFDAKSASKHELWKNFGLTEDALIARMTIPIMNKFFTVSKTPAFNGEEFNVGNPAFNIEYGYQNTLEALNRMRVLSV